MDAENYAAQIRQRCLTVLHDHEHLPCDWSNAAGYQPESGAVVCGCGEFFEMPGQVQADANAADRATSTALAPAGITYEARDPIDSTLALIDPTEVYAPVDVERHILDVLARLETGALFEREVIVKHYEAREAHDRAYWTAHAKSDARSADQRKAEAMLATTAERALLLETEMMAQAVKASMHNLRAILSGYQSTARSVGSAYQAGGSQGGVPR